MQLHANKIPDSRNLAIQRYTMKKVAFICVHNSCRSQMAEALGKHFASDVFESYSAGTQTKPQINPDAVRIIKACYGGDISSQHSKLLSDIPELDIAISMGCNVAFPFIGRDFDEHWAIEDSTGCDDQTFIAAAKQIERKILSLRKALAAQEQ